MNIHSALLLLISEQTDTHRAKLIGAFLQLRCECASKSILKRTTNIKMLRKLSKLWLYCLSFAVPKLTNICRPTEATRVLVTELTQH